MENYDQKLLDTEQTKLDLIELGAVYAAGALISELNAHIEDDSLTIERLRSLHSKLGGLLEAVDKVAKDYSDMKDYYNRKRAASERKE